MVAEAETPCPTAPPSRPRPRRARSRASKAWPLSLSKGTLSAAGRNKMAVNPLKTNDPAKSMISRPNDINDLRPASRNLSFRLAKHTVRFLLFQALSAPETQRGAWSERGRAGASRHGASGAPAGKVAQLAKDGLWNGDALANLMAQRAARKRGVSKHA